MTAARTLLCLALLLLTACGGGGDEAIEPAPEAPAITPVDRCHPLPPGSCR